MKSVRDKIKRKLSMNDKNPNLDEYEDENDVDDETAGHLGREADKAERDGHDQGKPGSFLNKLIVHGNKKTEDQIAREQQQAQQAQLADRTTRA